MEKALNNKAIIFIINTINNNKKDIIVINRRKQLIWEVKMMLKEQNYRTLSGR